MSNKVDSLIRKFEDDELKHDLAIEKIQVAISSSVNFWTISAGMFVSVLLSTIFTVIGGLATRLSSGELFAFFVTSFVLVCCASIPAVPALYEVHLTKKRDLMKVNREMFQRLNRKYKLSEGK